MNQITQLLYPSSPAGSRLILAAHGGRGYFLCVSSKPRCIGGIEWDAEPHRCGGREKEGEPLGVSIRRALDLLQRPTLW